MTTKKKKPSKETAESMAARQREISVSEFFLKNRHLLGFDSLRKALLTTVKEAVDNAMDACEEAGILPEISVDIQQTDDKRFRINVTDNGPGIVRNQIPKIFAKLLYGSKFHRLRMSRGQQGIGISAAGMYGQLTTGSATHILSTTKGRVTAHDMQVQIDTKTNKPVILRDQQAEWQPVFYPAGDPPPEPVTYPHGTSVSIEMEAAYVRGRLSVDEYLKQCAIVNPHLQLHYRIQLLEKGEGKALDAGAEGVPVVSAPWFTFFRAIRELPAPPVEIKPHPHGVELGLLMKMLKDSPSRTLRGALSEDFSRISSKTALEICERAERDPKSKPARVAHQESEALFKAIQGTKLMRPQTDCLSPIGEEQMIAGLKKEVTADFYTAVTRKPAVYRGNPFLVEVALAYARPGVNEELGAEDPVRVLRIANRVPLLYMAGGCVITKAISKVNWKAYGLSQPRGGLPVGPMLITAHMASVWVPFTSESKEAIAHYAEIEKELTFALQECGRHLSVFLSRRHKAAEMERKRNYIELYIPHLALGLKDILDLSDQQEAQVQSELKSMLERSRLEV
ncbi:MAG: DNA topoisomerase VI subunit B [Kiritimatiellae bacterium]|nr:DNA topoisomerase VI subunit B [Kiritimatiellia bacterium]